MRRAGLSAVFRGGSVPVRHSTHDGFAALNIYKDPSKAPVEKADSEYPDWLWTIMEPGRTYEELYREASANFSEGGYDKVFNSMSDKDLRRLFKLDNTARIKAGNGRRRGGRIV